MYISKFYTDSVIDGFNIKVEKIWYDALVSGKKKIEGRRAEGKWLTLLSMIGEILYVYTTDQEKTPFMIMAVREYNNTENMLINEGLRNVLPGIKTVNEGLEIYNSYYPDYNGKMLAIELNNLF